MRRAVFWIAVLAACPGLAWAQPAAPPASAPQVNKPPPATPQQIAAAKAEADRIIAASHAGRWFVNATAGAQPEARHTPSGMVCGFVIGQRNEIRIPEAAAAQGDEVSCVTTLISKDGPPIQLTQSAVRPAAPRTVEQELQLAMAAFRQRDPAAKPADGQFSNLRLGGTQVGHAALRIEMTDGGQRIYARAGAAVVGAWVVTQSLTTPVANARSADLVGELMLSVAVNQVAAVEPNAKIIADAKMAANDAAAEEARRLLKGVREQAEFADLTADGVTRIQHKASGVTCQFGALAAANRLAGSAMGMICATALDFEVQNLEVAFAPQMTDTAAQESVTKFITEQFPGAEPIEGFKDLKAGRPDTPDHAVRRFSATGKNGGPKVFVRVAYSQVGDWAIFQRVIAPIGAEKLSDDTSERRLLAAIAQVMDRQRAGAGPLGAGPRRGG